MSRRASLVDDMIAVLAVDAGIPPWDARERLTYRDAASILALLYERATAH